MTEKYFETQINNFRFTHLSFPINLETTWDVNLYNTSGPSFRYYISLDDTFNTKDSIFKHVIKVENEPKQNQVVEKSHQETFAENVGCISKKIINIETQFGKKRGYSAIYTIYDYKI